MATKKSDDQNLRTHPLVSALLDHGTDVRAFRGYVGPSKENGRVRLYPRLGDLNFCLEFNESDIIATAPAPESFLPHGGTVIWVGPDAEVVCRGEQVNAISARQPRRRSAPVGRPNANQARTAAGQLVEVQTGRVSIQFRERVMDSCASCTCASCDANPTCQCVPGYPEPVQ
jgi:hypothetical protein